MNRIVLLFGVAVLLVPSLAEARSLKSSTTKAEVLKLDAQGEYISACCPDRCIRYKHHRPCKKICCECAPPIETVLLVKDPCVCGCFVEVPVCLPACCTDVPKICGKSGLLGRDIVEYEWCCGYRVKIVFNRHGDATVHYYGV